MTEREKIRNGLKFDSIEIRQDTEKINFSAIVFVGTWIITELALPSDNIVMLIALIIISFVGFLYGMRMFAYMMKLDFIFAGQFIRDIESVAKFIIKKINKK